MGHRHPASRTTRNLSFVQQILFKADATGPGEPVRLFRHARVAGFSVNLNQDNVLTRYSGKVDRR